MKISVSMQIMCSEQKSVLLSAESTPETGIQIKNNVFWGYIQVFVWSEISWRWFWWKRSRFVTPFSLIGIYSNFTVKYCLHHQSRSSWICVQWKYGSKSVWNIGSLLPKDTASYYSRHWSSCVDPIHKVGHVSAPFLVHFPIMRVSQTIG